MTTAEKYPHVVRGFGAGHRSRRETGLGRCGAITMESGAKASEAEKAICADATLSSLDGDLAAAWKRTLAEASDAGALKASQRDWLTQRDACGSDTRCLADRYHERLSVLGKDYVTLVDMIDVRRNDDDEDALGANVNEYFVCGIANTNAAIVMSRGDRLWIGMLVFDARNHVRMRY
ncbi:lysozyme inhibitor LprI family protein [Burkholderia ubonensis]|uniref:lysozyme inhibitor LprI family protein n=2 Tax=Burkholderia ubonensis TaxID=101571 RepID=UPI000A4A68FB